MSANLERAAAILTEHVAAMVVGRVAELIAEEERTMGPGWIAADVPRFLVQPTTLKRLYAKLGSRIG